MDFINKDIYHNNQSVSDYVIKKRRQSKEWRERYPDRAREYYRNYRKVNVKKINEYRMQWRDRQKLKIYSILGEICVLCGFSDKRALQIDHINGGGGKEVRNSTKNHYLRVLRDLEVNPKKYQMLCANCNWIKRVENKEYRE